MLCRAKLGLCWELALPYSFNRCCRLMINLVAKEVGNKWLIAMGAIRVLAFDYVAHSYARESGSWWTWRWHCEDWLPQAVAAMTLELRLELGLWLGLGSGEMVCLEGCRVAGQQGWAIKKTQRFWLLWVFCFLAIDVGTIVTTVVLAIANRALHALNYVFGIGCVTL